MRRLGSERKICSVNRDDYELLEEIGQGASATVYRATYLPSNNVVAVKCLDLERCNSDLDNVQKEAQTMSLIDHPNLITSYCSFVVERCLWVVMPFMAEGSCLHIMKFALSDGLRESVICSILKETLKALEYLHGHGHIHRDVKAGNILLDSDGTVKLGDFGVSACMFANGDRQRARNTFIGTPCWMAPEVMQPGNGYDFKADIWSFGITALELAHGHAPFSKYPPMKVLLMTLQNAPPGLDYDRDKKFSKSFKEMVAMCLMKDQKKRPTAAKLLKHSFFKRAKAPGLSVRKVLLDLPPLWDRVRSLQLKDAAQLALKEMPSAEQEALSQREYRRSVSGWNFDVEDLKIQASLVQDDDDVTGIKEEDQRTKLVIDYMDASSSPSGFGIETSISSNGIDCSGSEVSHAERLNAIPDFGNKENFDGNGNSEPTFEALEKMLQGHPKSEANKNSQALNLPLMPNKALGYSLSERALTSERCEKMRQERVEKSKHDMQRAPSFNCSLMLPNQASMNSSSVPIRTSAGHKDTSEDSAKANLVQIKGRFSVTSENVDLAKESCMIKSVSVGDFLHDSKQVPRSQSSKEACNVLVPASFLISRLRSLLKHTSSLQDSIMISMNSLQQAEAADALRKGKPSPQHINSETGATVETADSEIRHSLLLKISELQSRVTDLTDALTAENLKHQQLQAQQNAPYCQNEDRDQRREGNN